MKLLHRFFGLILSGLVFSLVITSANAQDYPKKPIRIIVGTGPGGGIDIVNRILGAQLSERFGQPVVIENKPGAGTILSVIEAVKATPDGYTLLGISSSYLIQTSMNSKLPNVLKAFNPVTIVAMSVYALIVHPSVPAHTVKEFITVAKSNPGKLYFGSSGTGAESHLAGELFKSMAKIDMVHIPYKGGPPALTALLGAEVQAIFVTLMATLPHHKAGKARILAVLGSHRARAMPDLPTVAEAGLPNYAVSPWYGMFVPAGTPKEIILKLNKEYADIIRMPIVKERLSDFDLISMKPEEFTAFIKAESERWGKVIKSLGLRAE